MGTLNAKGFVTRRVRPLVVFTLSLLRGFALDPEHSITQYGHKAWTRHDGQVGVSSLAQTEDGKLWVGTEFGRFYFDGVSFTAWEPTVGVQKKISELITALAANPRGAGCGPGLGQTVFYFDGAKLQSYRIAMAPKPFL